MRPELGGGSSGTRTMTPAPFNSFHAARALESAGVERSQAEAIASAIGHTGDTATKGDVSAVKDDVSAVKADVNAVKDDVNAVKDDVNAVKDDVNAVKAEINIFKAEVNARIASLEARMYRALWIQGGAIVAIVAALKLLD